MFSHNPSFKSSEEECKIIVVLVIEYVRHIKNPPENPSNQKRILSGSKVKYSDDLKIGSNG